MKKKSIKNTKNGFHFNSKYWQEYKKKLPKLPSKIFEIAFGMMLGDATMYHISREAYMKFEQGWKQREFLYHLFDIFSTYSFMVKPSKRYKKENKRLIKSYWFKTFSFPDFTLLYQLFYNKGQKVVKKGIILDHLTALAFTYWIMSDGSLQKDKKTLIMHTQGFSLKENNILSQELNKKFQLNSQVKSHKAKYYVIEIPSADAQKVYNLINSFLIPSMRYKLPIIE